MKHQSPIVAWEKPHGGFLLASKLIRGLKFKIRNRSRKNLCIGLVYH